MDSCAYSGDKAGAYYIDRYLRCGDTPERNRQRKGNKRPLIILSIYTTSSSFLISPPPVAIQTCKTIKPYTPQLRVHYTIIVAIMKMQLDVTACMRAAFSSACR